ncbi:hypothetical protein ACQP2K_30985 [Microbispora siamensis]
MPRLLEAMSEADDYYFTSTCQVRLDRWSSGRIALVGDAGCCAAPTSGMGTSQALIGARTLARAGHPAPRRAGRRPSSLLEDVMMRVIAEAVLHLYPKAWRERYGEEVADLVASRPVRLRTVVDLLRGGADAWLHRRHIPGSERIPAPSRSAFRSPSS